MTVSFDRCCRPRNLINSFGSRKATADTVVPYFLFLHIWQKLLVSAYNCYYVYRKKEGKARASVSYARLTSFPHTKRGLFLHSLVLRLLRLHQCTREEFNSFCARVEEGWPPRNCLDNCLLCKWKQQSHYSTFCKSHLQKSRTTKCKSGLGLLCSRPDLTLLPWKDYSEMKHFSDSRLLSFLCDVHSAQCLTLLKNISYTHILSHFTTLRAKRVKLIFESL